MSPHTQLLLPTPRRRPMALTPILLQHGRPFIAQEVHALSASPEASAPSNMLAPTHTD